MFPGVKSRPEITVARVTLLSVQDKKAVARSALAAIAVNGLSCGPSA